MASISKTPLTEGLGLETGIYKCNLPWYQLLQLLFNIRHLIYRLDFDKTTDSTTYIHVFCAYALC